MNMSAKQLIGYSRGNTFRTQVHGHGWVKIVSRATKRKNEGSQGAARLSSTLRALGRIPTKKNLKM